MISHRTGGGNGGWGSLGGGLEQPAIIATDSLLVGHAYGKDSGQCVLFRHTSYRLGRGTNNGTSSHVNPFPPLTFEDMLRGGGGVRDLKKVIHEEGFLPQREIFS